MRGKQINYCQQVILPQQECDLNTIKYSSERFDLNAFIYGAAEFLIRIRNLLFMGGSISKRGSSRQRSSSRSTTSSPWYPQYQSPYLPQSQDHHEHVGYNGHPSQSYGGGHAHAPEQRNGSDRKYSRIGDHYNSLDQVTFLCPSDSQCVKCLKCRRITWYLNEKCPCIFQINPET